MARFLADKSALARMRSPSVSATQLVGSEIVDGGRMLVTTMREWPGNAPATSRARWNGVSARAVTDPTGLTSSIRSA